MKKKRHRGIAEMGMALLVAAMAFQLTSCGRTSAGAAEPTPPDVEVVTVEQKDIPVYREWIGTLDGQVNAAIRSQVTGYLLTQDYSEGSFVKRVSCSSRSIRARFRRQRTRRGGNSHRRTGSWHKRKRSSSNLRRN